MAAAADLLHHGHHGHGHGGRAGVIRVPEPSDQRVFPVSSEKDNDLRNNSNEKAAVEVLERWWVGVRNRKLFYALKHAICAAEHSLTKEVLRKLSPREASLLSDPVLQPKVKFRLSGLQFPPVVVFKIFLSTHSKYISGRNVIRPASEAAIDACHTMGNRKFYDQLLLDTCQHRQMKVTDPVDITTVKDYMKYASCLDESPAYMGGRDNQWRRITLDSLPRYSEMYNVVDFLSCANHPDMRGRSMEWIASFSRPASQADQIQRITALSSISPSTVGRTPSPRKPVTPSSLDKPQSRERQSRIAQQRVKKMRRAYSLGSGRENSAASVGERLVSAGHRKEEGEDEEIELEEEEAVDLYKWSQELSFDDLS